MEEADRKRTLYVGGLEDKVDVATLTAAFLPFGEIKDVQIPTDHATQKPRGFGFVQFEEIEDAMAAADNMHHAGKRHGWCRSEGGRSCVVLCVSFVL